MIFKFRVTIDSPSASPYDQPVWSDLLKGVSPDQSKVHIIVEPKSARSWLSHLNPFEPWEPLDVVVVVVVAFILGFLVRKWLHS